MALRAPLIMKSSPARFIFFLSVWLMIAGWRRDDLPVGLIASALAAWISLSLLPSAAVRPRLASLAKLSLRFFSGSIIAGLDVARRALLRHLDLRPGFVDVVLTLPPGAARNAFLLYQSLQPGTSPTSAEGDVLKLHCLDISQPIATTVLADDTLFKKAIGYE